MLCHIVLNELDQLESMKLLISRCQMRSLVDVPDKADYVVYQPFG
jgi:hypothetical protein